MGGSGMRDTGGRLGGTATAYFSVLKSTPAATEAAKGQDAGAHVQGQMRPEDGEAGEIPGNRL